LEYLEASNIIGNIISNNAGLAIDLFPVGVIIYYLAWKHIVGRLNAIIGIA